MANDKDKIAELEAQLTTANAQLADAQKAYETANAELKQKTTELNDALAINEQLQEALATTERHVAADKPVPAPKPLLPAKPVKHDGVDYVFTMPVFMLDGKKVLATEAAKDKEIIKQLVDMSSGVLAPANA